MSRNALLKNSFIGYPDLFRKQLIGLSGMNPQQKEVSRLTSSFLNKYKLYKGHEFYGTV